VDSPPVLPLLVTLEALATMDTQHRLCKYNKNNYTTEKGPTDGGGGVDSDETRGQTMPSCCNQLLLCLSSFSSSQVHCTFHAIKRNLIPRTVYKEKIKAITAAASLKITSI